MSKSVTKIVLSESRNIPFNLLELSQAKLLRTPWRPHHGSLVSHRTLTAAMIDSRDFLAAKRRSEIEPLVPAGTKIAFAGGDYSDHERIWSVLDKVLAKHPDMVLLHGGSPKGAERAAACWARNRKIAQIEFKPDWTLGRSRGISI